MLIYLFLAAVFFIRRIFGGLARRTSGGIDLKFIHSLRDNGRREELRV